MIGEMLGDIKRKQKSATLGDFIPELLRLVRSLFVKTDLSFLTKKNQVFKNHF